MTLKKTEKQQKRRDRLGQQRQMLADQFKRKYGSANSVGEANVAPHFIGVWDTVAAVGVPPPIWRLILGAAALATVFLSLGLATWVSSYFNLGFGASFAISTATLGLSALAAYLTTTLKFTKNLPGVPLLKTVHLTPVKMAFFDNKLNRHVRYARHAIAIDERRADFDRVPWVNEGDAPNREIAEGAWFKQIWFAGNHSDVGGSYPENESRLSDISLKWMATEAKKAGLLVDPTYLRTFGSSDGPQHDELSTGIRAFGMRFSWREGERKMVPNAPLHPSVADRCIGPAILNYGVFEPYRPALLQGHEKFADLYKTASDGGVNRA